MKAGIDPPFLFLDDDTVLLLRSSKSEISDGEVDEARRELLSMV